MRRQPKHRAHQSRKRQTFPTGEALEQLREANRFPTLEDEIYSFAQNLTQFEYEPTACRHERQQTDDLNNLLDGLKTKNASKILALLKKQSVIKFLNDYIKGVYYYEDDLTFLHVAAAYIKNETVLAQLAEYLSPKERSLTKGITPIHLAAYNGNQIGVAFFCKQDTTLVYIKDYLERTPLHYASQSGKLDVVKTLLAHGAHPDVTDFRQNTALHYAAIQGHREIIDALLAKMADFGIKNEHKYNALECAVIYSPNVITCFLEKITNTPQHINLIAKALEVSMLFKNTLATTTLLDFIETKAFNVAPFITALETCLRSAQKAAKPDNELIARFTTMIAKFDPEKQSEEAQHHHAVPSSSTPMPGEIAETHVLDSIPDLAYEMARLNSQFSVEWVNLPDTSERTQSEIDKIEQHKILIQALRTSNFQQITNSLNNKALKKQVVEFDKSNTKQGSKSYRTYLNYIAANIKNVGVLKAIANELILDQQSTNEKYTAMHFAACRGNTEVAKFLCQKKPQLAYNRDILSRTPLHFAAYNGHADIVYLLLSDPHNADPNLQDFRNYTALHYAVMSKSLETVNLILGAKQKPDLTLKNMHGQSAVDLAFALPGSSEILSAFLAHIKENLPSEITSLLYLADSLRQANINEKILNEHQQANLIILARIDEILDKEDAQAAVKAKQAKDKAKPSSSSADVKETSSTERNPDPQEEDVIDAATELDEEEMAEYFLKIHGKEQTKPTSAPTKPVPSEPVVAPSPTPAPAQRGKKAAEPKPRNHNGQQSRHPQGNNNNLRKPAPSKPPKPAPTKPQRPAPKPAAAAAPMPLPVPVSEAEHHPAPSPATVVEQPPTPTAEYKDDDSLIRQFLGLVLEEQDQNEPFNDNFSNDIQSDKESGCFGYIPSRSGLYLGPPKNVGPSYKLLMEPKFDLQFCEASYRWHITKKS